MPSTQSKRQMSAYDIVAPPPRNATAASSAFVVRNQRSKTAHHWPCLAPRRQRTRARMGAKQHAPQSTFSKTSFGMKLP